jgi:hypothetical protein
MVDYGVVSEGATKLGRLVPFADPISAPARFRKDRVAASQLRHMLATKC